MDEAGQSLVTDALRLFKRGRYRLTIHAENERDKDDLTISMIEECFGNDTIELIEDYPEDPRGHSFLLVGFTSRQEAIHFVCAMHEEELIFITIYKPDPTRWRDFRERIK